MVQIHPEAKDTGRENQGNAVPSISPITKTDAQHQVYRITARLEPWYTWRVMLSVLLILTLLTLLVLTESSADVSP